MLEDTGWKCKNCGNFNVRTKVCLKCNEEIGFDPNQSPPVQTAPRKGKIRSPSIWDSSKPSNEIVLEFMIGGPTCSVWLSRSLAPKEREEILKLIEQYEQDAEQIAFRVAGVDDIDSYTQKLYASPGLAPGLEVKWLSEAFPQYQQLRRELVKGFSRIGWQEKNWTNMAYDTRFREINPETGKWNVGNVRIDLVKQDKTTPNLKPPAKASTAKSSLRDTRNYVKYEYKTIVIENLWMKTETHHWMIPDKPLNGISPPTIDQVKQMLWDQMQINPNVKKSLIGIILEETPEGWELIGQLDIQDFELGIRRGPAYENGALTKYDAITHVDADTFKFEVRRPLKKDQPKKKSNVVAENKRESPTRKTNKIRDDSKKKSKTSSRVIKKSL